MTGPNASGWGVVGLVARRELSTRLRSKAYRITTLVMMIIVVGLCVGVKLVNANGTGLTVGYPPATASLATQLKAVAGSTGQSVTLVPLPDQATGEARVRAGSLDAALTGDGGTVAVVVKKDVDRGLRTALNALSGQLAFAQQIHRLGGDPSAVAAAAAASRPTVRSLQPPYPYQTQQLVLGIVAGVLIYLSLLLNGQFVAQGVVEEKSSRVVELLLATIRPWQLMAGKVAGIGLVGLIQMFVIGAAGIVAGRATGVLTVSVSAAASTVVWLIAWYLLGFFMYAVVFGALGALVSRQEDVGGVVAPALMFLVLGYVLGISILPSNPSSSLMEVLSILPMFAPTVMPMRLAMGGVPAWEAGLSVALALAVIPALIWLAARIYRNAVLRTGARVSLRQALRAA